jgi:YfiH family protein
MAPGEESANIVENRRRFFRALKLPHGPLTTVNQVHSADVVPIRPPAERGATGEEADALITDCVEVPLAVFHADCLPIVIYDPRVRACGLAHAGREGLRQGIARAMVEAMARELGSDPHDLRAAVGPGIRACCYEVGPEVVEAWRRSVPQAEELLVPEFSGKARLDLPGAIASQLLGEGLRREHIHDTGLCTACRTDAFYSYRAEGPGTGRLMTVVVLLPAVS